MEENGIGKETKMKGTTQMNVIEAKTAKIMRTFYLMSAIVCACTSVQMLLEPVHNIILEISISGICALVTVLFIVMLAYSYKKQYVQGLDIANILIFSVPVMFAVVVSWNILYKDYYTWLDAMIYVFMLFLIECMLLIRATYIKGIIMAVETWDK